MVMRGAVLLVTPNPDHDKSTGLLMVVMIVRGVTPPLVGTAVTVLVEDVGAIMLRFVDYCRGCALRAPHDFAVTLMPTPWETPGAAVARA